MKTKNIIAGLAALIGVYLVYIYYNKKKPESKALEEDKLALKKEDTTPSVNYFPLKKGSKNVLVSKLQQLILKIDKSLLPKYGVDGNFGSETELAVKKLLNKKTIDSENDFNTLNNLSNKNLFPLITGKGVSNNSSVPLYDPKKIF